MSPTRAAARQSTDLLAGQVQIGSLGSTPVIPHHKTGKLKILAQPAIRERLAPQGLEAVGGSPEQFARLYRDDYEKYGKLVKELNIKID